MNLLHIAVHHHKEWGAEHWLSFAFERAGCNVIRYNYRRKRQLLTPWWLIEKQLLKINSEVKLDGVLIQRGEKIPASIPALFDCPTIFWSTEPLIRRRDHDALLNAHEHLDWVYVHTHTSKGIVDREFPNIANKSSVFHYAGASEFDPGDNNRTRLAVFNRNVSKRRREWLNESSGLVDVIEGQYGKKYFEALRSSQIALNIHFADSSVDDFETGIFEALASGCVVVTETLNPLVVSDMGMENALVQVKDAVEMRRAIEDLRDNPEKLLELQENGRKALENNRWDNRAEQMLEKFAEIKMKTSTAA
ncbi:MAG: glycosyltransferase [Granulosicoccus sp.]